MAVNGVATFAGVTLNQTGSGFTLLATSNDLTVVTTNALSVTPAIPTQLVFAVPPPESVAADSSFGLVVYVDDVLENVATSFQGTVVLSLSSNPGDATLGGTVSVTAINGVATFAGLTLDQQGDGYTLLATSNGLPSSTSGAINVTPAAAKQLVVRTQPPSSIPAGDSFGLVVVADSGGVVDTSFNGTVIVQLNNNPGGAFLGGTASVTAVNGVATFAGLTLSQMGNGYTLYLGGAPYASTTTGILNVTKPDVPNIPALPQLAPQSDTGVSNSDGLTRDNGSAATPLTFTVGGISPSNSFVQLIGRQGDEPPLSRFYSAVPFRPSAPSRRSR